MIKDYSDLTADNDHYGNTMIGYNMPTNPGHRNTLIGDQAGAALTQANDAEHGGENTFIGSSSGLVATSASFNAAVGVNSGRSLTTGNENTFIGLGAGFHITTGTRNVCIGKDVGPPSSNNDHSNRLYIDAKNAHAGGNCLIYGDQSGSQGQLVFNAMLHVQDTSASTSSGTIRLYDSDGKTGNEYVGIKAPSSVTDAYTLTLPPTSGSEHQILRVDANGDLQWNNQAYSSQYVVPTAQPATDIDYDVTFVSMGSNSSVTTNLRAVNNSSGNKRLTYNPNSGTLFSIQL